MIRGWLIMLLRKLLGVKDDETLLVYSDGCECDFAFCRRIG